MKRLGFLVLCISLLLHIGTTFSSYAHAQGIDRIIAQQQQGTYDYFYNQGISILDATIKSLDDTRKAVEQSTNEPNKQTIAATLAKNILIFQREKASYTSSFNQSRSSGVAAAQSQINANVAAEATFQSEWGALTVQEKQEPRAQGIIATYRTQWSQLLVQARQIQAGTITAGSAEANSLGNATAVSTAGQSASTIVNNNTASKCTSLFNASIIDCIDAGFAWIIKNTLLQIAGFLVWLAANMLNYAIQVSILDFANWSPPTLYPIWIIIRQIVSLIVVFAGLYLGFMYIIGREDTFGKYVGWLIIFALFVNFSYPVTRALVDVSNVISLNVYSSAVGNDALTNDFATSAAQQGGNTAGALIMNRLGLQGLVTSATQVESGQAGFIGNINSTPGALIAIIFVLYAAFVLFMATAIIVVRAAVLAFLIVGSPILLIDSVVPKLGDAAVKMRKLFFEQLVSAPVFMIMLALTLKFMEVFQSTTGPLGQASNTLSTLSSGGADSVKTFFNILMMLIMLHIMLKVTKAVAGKSGEYATNFIGKAGGFGLGVASGGAGILARGSIGAAAARLRDSGMMDKMQSSRTGRGLYSLTNSLAQSTYDTRNIGMVSKGMASAGMGMGKGSTQTYDTRFKEKDTVIRNKYGSIKDGAAREKYLNQQAGGVVSSVRKGALSPLALVGVASKDRQDAASIIAENIRKNEDKSLNTYAKIKDEDKKREYFDALPQNLQAQIKDTEKAQSNPAESIKEETLTENERATSPAKTTNESVSQPQGVPEYEVPATKSSATVTATSVGMPPNQIAPQMGPNDGPQRPTLAQSQAANSEPALEKSYADLENKIQNTQAQTMGEQQIANMQKRFNMSSSWRKERGSISENEK